MADFNSIVPSNSMDAYVQTRNDSQQTINTAAVEITSASQVTNALDKQQVAPSAESENASSFSSNNLSSAQQVSQNTSPENRKAISAYLQVEQFQGSPPGAQQADPTTVPPPMLRGGVDVKA